MHQKIKSTNLLRDQRVALSVRKVVEDFEDRLRLSRELEVVRNFAYKMSVL